MKLDVVARVRRPRSGHVRTCRVDLYPRSVWGPAVVFDGHRLRLEDLVRHQPPDAPLPFAVHYELCNVPEVARAALVALPAEQAVLLDQWLESHPDR